MTPLYYRGDVIPKIDAWWNFVHINVNCIRAIRNLQPLDDTTGDAKGVCATIGDEDLHGFPSMNTAQLASPSVAEGQP
jgi:hypothetical protein